MRIWSIDREPELLATISAGLRGVVRRIRFALSGESLLTVTDASQVAQWRLSDGAKEAEWRPNQIITTSHALADHGRTVALGRTDGSVHVYQLTAPVVREKPPAPPAAPSLAEMPSR